MSLASYRLYFRAPSGEILGRDDFDAEDDRAAAVMAGLLSDACADLCDSFELWQYQRLVDSARAIAAHPRESAAQVSARTQESLIRREEAIHRSEWSVARSRRLLERMQSLEADLRRHP